MRRQFPVWRWQGAFLGTFTRLASTIFFRRFVGGESPYGATTRESLLPSFILPIGRDERLDVLTPESERGRQQRLPYAILRQLGPGPSSSAAWRRASSRTRG